MRRETLRLRWPLMAVQRRARRARPSRDERRRRRGARRRRGRRARPRERHRRPSGITTSFDVTLAPRDETGLTNYIASLSDTASSNYHHYLTPRQFAQRYGASASSVAAVRSYFAGFGLRVGSLAADDSSCTCAAPRPRSRAPSPPAWRPSVEPTACWPRNSRRRAPCPGPSRTTSPASQDSPRSCSRRPTRCVSRVHSNTAIATTCPDDGGETSTTPNADGGYTPFQFAQLYGLTPMWANGITGVGQTIAVYELSALRPGRPRDVLQRVMDSTPRSRRSGRRRSDAVATTTNRRSTSKR